MVAFSQDEINNAAAGSGELVNPNNPAAPLPQIVNDINNKNISTNPSLFQDSPPLPGENSITGPGIGPKTINWLGSSYSGTDIRVVAQLYLGSSDKNTQQVQNDIDVALIAARGATACMTNLPAASFSPGDNLDDIFAGACFGMNQSDPVSVAALSLLRQNLGVFVGPVLSKNPQALGAFAAACQSFATTENALANELSHQQQAIAQMVATSTQVLLLQQLQTLSVQTYRPKTQVRGLGNPGIKGTVKGQRTIAGSMIFTVFDEHPLSKLMRAVGDAKLYGESAYNDPAAGAIRFPDQMPPIDLTIIYANEYGSISRMGIYGVEFLTDGVTHSIEDIYSEQVLQFIARDVDIMSSVGIRKLSQATKSFYNNGKVIAGTDLYFASKDAYDDYINRLGLSNSFTGR